MKNKTQIDLMTQFNRMQNYSPDIEMKKVGLSSLKNGVIPVRRSNSGSQGFFGAE